MAGEIEGNLLALRIAMQMEKDGHQFYLSAADKSDDSRTKAIFSTLANDEVQHLHWLKAQYEGLLQDKQWPSTAGDVPRVEFAEGEPTPIFSQERLTEEVSIYTSELSALRQAYLLEKDAVAFYAKAATETNDPHGQAMYQALAAWEQEHQQVLETEYKFLAEQFKTQMGFAPF